MKRTSSMFYQSSPEASELVLTAVNDGDLFEGRIKSIIGNLRRKVKKGIYDPDRAVDLYYRLACDASRVYFEQFGYRFTVTERFTAAVELEEYYREQIMEAENEV